MYFKYCLVKILVLVSVLFTVPYNIYAAVSGQGVKQKILFASENYSSTSSAVMWKSSNDGNLKKLTPSYIVGRGGITNASFPTTSQAQQTIKNAISLNLPSYIKSLSPILKQEQYNFARLDWSYAYIDEGDSNITKKVYYMATIYPDGSTRLVGWKTITTSPRTLYYVYKSKVVDAVLPAGSGWGYTDGGILYKYVLDENNNIISSTSVDTGGKYDPPSIPIGESVVDEYSEVKLLIDEVIKPDIKNRSALYAILDYTKQIEPAYNCDKDGNCTPQMSIEGISRTAVKYCKGGYKYTNTGRIGYTLAYSGDRIYIDPDGNYSLLSIDTGYSVSPLQKDFSHTLVVDGSINYYDLIDPFKGSTIYQFNNDTVNEIPCSSYIYAGKSCSQPTIEVQSGAMGCTPGQTWHPRFRVWSCCKDRFVLMGYLKAVCRADGQSLDWYGRTFDEYTVQYDSCNDCGPNIVNICRMKLSPIPTKTTGLVFNNVDVGGVPFGDPGDVVEISSSSCNNSGFISANAMVSGYINGSVLKYSVGFSKGGGQNGGWGSADLFTIDSCAW